ncbi:MAG: hypothetical protein R6V03_03285 [Kiritimatiellia bacterium]
MEFAVCPTMEGMGHMTTAGPELHNPLCERPENVTGENADTNDRLMRRIVETGAVMPGQ